MEALADPAVRAKLAALGQEIFPHELQNPQALDSHQKSEIANDRQAGDVAARSLPRGLRLPIGPSRPDALNFILGDDAA
ncbi:MAG TPA: hypothetical protein VKB89_11220 [Xanthobacteraceae bacterium]|nr:hypothetical protein [Xanthobacteraceae bacterium]